VNSCYQKQSTKCSLKPPYLEAEVIKDLSLCLWLCSQGY